MRRVHLRRRDNIQKRVLIQVGGYNLGVMMRKLVGVGKPRTLQRALRDLLRHASALLHPFYRSSALLWDHCLLFTTIDGPLPSDRHYIRAAT